MFLEHLCIKHNFVTMVPWTSYNIRLFCFNQNFIRTVTYTEVKKSFDDCTRKVLSSSHQPYAHDAENFILLVCTSWHWSKKAFNLSKFYYRLVSDVKIITYEL